MTDQKSLLPEPLELKKAQSDGAVPLNLLPPEKYQHLTNKEACGQALRTASYNGDERGVAYIIGEVDKITIFDPVTKTNKPVPDLAKLRQQVLESQDHGELFRSMVDNEDKDKDKKGKKDGKKDDKKKDDKKKEEDTHTKKSEKEEEAEKEKKEEEEDAEEAAEARKKGKKLRVMDTGDTALHLAVAKSHADIIEALIRFGAKIDSTNRIGSTPLHRAVAVGDVHIVQRLIELGAGLDLLNNIGNTIIHIAAFKNDADLLHVILEAVEVYATKSGKGKDWSVSLLRKVNYVGLEAFHYARAKARAVLRDFLHKWGDVHMHTLPSDEKAAQQ